MPKQRTKRIVVRVSVDEHRAISQKAVDADMTVSELTRDHMNRIRIHNHREQARLLQTLVGINNNLTAVTERVAGLHPTDAAILIAYAAAIHRRVTKIAQ